MGVETDRFAKRSSGLNLKIRDLRSFIVDTGRDENFVFAKVYTNQGLEGLGEATLTGAALPVAKAIDGFKPFLVGKDPTDIELLWQAMFRGPRYRAGLVMGSAISAIEIALWDILGQALGQPIWRLLGGKARDKVRIYPHPRRLLKSQASSSGGKLVRETAPEAWRRLKDEGWTVAKSGFLPTRGGIIDPMRSVRDGIAELREVREAVGEDFGICIDLHGKATPRMAIDFCRRAEEFSPLFVEEATQPEDVGELEFLRSRTRVPLATGERLVTMHAFSKICANRLVDFVQPDVIHCGGILQMKKIAALAEAFTIDVAPHNPQSEVSTLASLHVCFSTPNANLLEIGSGMASFWSDLFRGGAVEIEQGHALPPDRPGLGISLDEAVAAKSPYEKKEWRVYHFPDGSVGSH